MGKELEDCKWSKPDGENPHFRTQAARLSAYRWGCSEDGVQGHRPGRDLGSAQSLSPSVVRKALRGVGSEGRWGPCNKGHLFPTTT